MNFEKVMFAFFIVLAFTLNFSFFIGDFDNPEHHDGLELAAALAVSLIATIMKFGDRSIWRRGRLSVQFSSAAQPKTMSS